MLRLPRPRVSPLAHAFPTPYGRVSVRLLTSSGSAGHTRPRPVRGMHDRFAPESQVYRWIANQGRETAEAYGYTEVSTPMLEYAHVFERSLGETSDVVGKELYKFSDVNGELLTLRPEGTAGLVRALISGQRVISGQAVRLFYTGPMFRRERPQKGRLRQFEQFGVEALGCEHPTADVELIQMGWEFIKRIGLAGSATLEVNSIGGAADRLRYADLLRSYLACRASHLSDDSKRRLESNPLRILDSKVASDIEVIKNAPRMIDHLSEDARQRFAVVCKLLDQTGLPYTVNWRLVRGLDYYCDTVWEVKYAGEQLGTSQDTILAGGRYDGLFETLGGKSGTDTPMPAIGWAAGVDRLALLVPPEQVGVLDHAPTIAVIALPERAVTPTSAATGDGPTTPATSRWLGCEHSQSIYAAALETAKYVRSIGYRCVMVHPTLGKQPRLGRLFEQATRQSASIAILVGETEVERGCVSVRHLVSREKQDCPLNELPAVLRALSEHGCQTHSSAPPLRELH